MKISWGTGIVIVFVIFLGLLIWAVTASLQADHQLVAKDYYEQELDYGNRIAEIKNVNNLGDSFSIQQTAQGVEIEFPKHWDDTDIQGQVDLYKPDNINLDFKTPIQLTNHKQIIPISRFTQGKWKIKIAFKRNDTSYFKEDVFFF